jgi:YVTN family beta-propeller protein
MRPRKAIGTTVIVVVVAIMMMMATVGFVVLTSHPGAVATPYKSTTTSEIPSQSMTNTSTSRDTSTATTTVTSTSSAQIPLSLKTVASIPIVNPSQSVIRIAFDASNGYLYVANGSNTASVTVVDLSKNDSIIANIPLGNTTGGLLYDPSNGYVYASQGCLEIIHYGTRSNQTESSAGITAVIISGTKAIGQIDGPCASGGLTYDPSDHHIFEASDTNPSGIVNVIDDRSNTIVATIPVGNPMGISYDAGNGMVYVGDLSSGSADVISTATNGVVATIKLERGSPVYALNMVAYNPGDQLIYVATYGYNTEIKGTVIVGNFTVLCSGGMGSEFAGFAYDSVRGVSFMSACGTVVAVNGATDAELLGINVPGASSLVYDPSNYDLYVAANTGIVIISTTDG